VTLPFLAPTVLISDITVSDTISDITVSDTISDMHLPNTGLWSCPLRTCRRSGQGGQVTQTVKLEGDIWERCSVVSKHWSPWL
jgi:hypothetical protein